MSKFIDILKKKKENILSIMVEEKRGIHRMLFYVCSSCQNSCQYCQNEELMKHYENYQLSIDELNKFIYYTKKSDYYYDQFSICGVGEPLLWEHFNEGIKLLHDAKITRSIIIFSNGISVDNIKEETWQYLDNVRFSIFPNTKNKDSLDILERKYGKDKITLANYKNFNRTLDVRYANTTPCKCLCPGPTFVKDKVFFYCAAGPLFTAAKIMGVNIFDYTDMYSDVKENYLDRSDISIGKFGREFEFCECCGANANLYTHRKLHRHVQLKNNE